MISSRFTAIALCVLKTLQAEGGFAHRFELQDLDSDRDHVDQCIAHLVSVGRVRVLEAGATSFDLVEEC